MRLRPTLADLARHPTAGQCPSTTRTVPQVAALQGGGRGFKSLSARKSVVEMSTATYGAPELALSA